MTLVMVVMKGKFGDDGIKCGISDDGEQIENASVITGLVSA